MSDLLFGNGILPFSVPIGKFASAAILFDFLYSSTGPETLSSRLLAGDERIQGNIEPLILPLVHVLCSLVPFLGVGPLGRLVEDIFKRLDLCSHGSSCHTSSCFIVCVLYRKERDTGTGGIVRELFESFFCK